MRLFLFTLFVLFLGACKAPRNQNDSTALEATGELSIPDEPDEFPFIDFRRAKKADILGIPFGDTVLNEFKTDRNLGVNNIWLQDDFILRFAHLAEQHGRDLEKMGFESCYDFKAPRDTNDYREKQSGPKLFKATSLPRLTRDLYRARHCFLQEVRFPDNQWKTNRTPPNKQAPRVITLFMPNVLTVHLDTNGTWPFGRRPNDDMIGRFNALFLKMGSKPGDCSGNQDIEVLTKQGKKTNTGGLSASELCSLDSLSKPSNGSHVAQFTGWKTDKPAIPLNPPHKIKLASGEVKEGFTENQFPFLEPPNSGRGYYQPVPDSRKFHAYDYLTVKKGAKSYGKDTYKKKDPTIGFHPFCNKEGGAIRGEWKENEEARKSCSTESTDRFGTTGRMVDVRAPGLSDDKRASYAFYQTCTLVYRSLCQGVDIERIVF